VYAKWTLIPLIPDVISVNSTKTDGIYGLGTVISISVEFSRPVTVVGVPTLTLETGTNDAIASYKSTTADGKTLLFEYIVLATHTSSDLNYSSTTALALPTGASIKDTTHNTNATRTLPATTSSLSLAGSKALIIDTTAPATPTTPIVPQQANISLSSTSTGTFIAIGNAITVNVACVEGQRVKMYEGTGLISIETKNCTNTSLAVFTLPLSAASGYYIYYATVTDLAGNESSASPSVMVLKQSTSLTTGIPDLLSQYDFGVSSSDNFTYETQLGFTISCTSGAEVRLFDGGNVNPISTNSCIGGSALFPLVQPLSPGLHLMTAKQMIN
jgi:hypothetical protein